MLSETLLAAAPATLSGALGGTISIWAWLGFTLLVVVLLVLDMSVFHRQDHAPTLLESTGWTVFWIALALIFNAWIWWWFSWDYAIQFFSGYLLEKSLSMDNVFVFAVIFAYFRVPLKYQYRLLFWGVFGAIVMRLAFILLAAGLLERFEWVMYIFGAILLWSGIKLALANDQEIHPEDNPFVKFARKHFRISTTLQGSKFIVRQNGKLFLTPLFLVLLVVETTDVIFAVDSVPAIFGVTKIPFIVFTSNVFAIMGLRALYFLLAGVMDMFRYLHYGLAAVLCFIGVKMLAHHWLEDPEFLSQLPRWAAGTTADGAWYLAHWIPLAVIASLLGISIAASLVAGYKEADDVVEEQGDRPDAVTGAPAGEPQESRAGGPPPIGDDAAAEAIESSRTT